MDELTETMLPPEPGTAENTAGTAGNTAGPQSEKLARYTTSTKAPFECNVVEGCCGRKFNKPGSLVMHALRKHLGLNPNKGRSKSEYDYKCPYCERTFKNTANRNNHVVTSHEGLPIPPLVKRGRKSNTESGHGNGNGNGKLAVRATEQTQVEAFISQLQPGRKQVCFCPVCGTNIPAVQAAVNYAD